MYGKAFGSVLGGYSSGDAYAVDLLSDTMKLMLCTASYTPDLDAHQFKSDVTNEITGTGYTAGGVTLAGKTLTYSSGSNKTIFDCNDAVWAAATITFRYAILYKSTGTNSTSPLIGIMDFGSDVASTGGDATVVFNAGGVWELTAN